MISQKNVWLADIIASPHDTRRWLRRLGCGLVALSLALSQNSAMATEPGRPVDDAGEYDVLLEFVNELPSKSGAAILRDYLERYPRSVHRDEIEQLLADLEASVDPGPSPQSVRPRTVDPFTMTPLRPDKQFNGRLSLGSPSWFEILGTYAQPVAPRVSVIGTVGQAGGFTRLAAEGQLALVETPRNDGEFDIALALWADLGYASRFGADSYAAYAGNLGNVRYQARIGATLSPGLDLQFNGGASIGVPVGDAWLLGIEAAGYVKSVAALRTDFDSSIRVLAGFSALSAGVRYHLGPRVALDAVVSIPFWYRYDRVFASTICVGARYYFGR